MRVLKAPSRMYLIEYYTNEGHQRFEVVTSSRKHIALLKEFNKKGYYVLRTGVADIGNWKMENHGTLH